jgi:hypothetical protein
MLGSSKEDDEMGSIPEFINHYISKFFKVRIITTSEFDGIFTALTSLQAHQRKNNFKYLPNTPETVQQLKRIYSLISPKKVKDVNKIRLGNANDGGYVCLDYFKGIKAALSLGINDDVSWDIEVARRGLQIYQYDHTVEGPPIKHENFIFHKVKIDTVERLGSASLMSILERYQLSEPQSVILKMDIEGDEWDVLGSVSDETLDVFSQILCEFHNFERLLEPEFYKKIIGVLSKLREKFEVFHVHANNYGPLLLIPGVGSLPETLEIGFFRKQVFDFEDTDENFPGELDAPNNPMCDDYQFEFFR